MQAGKGVPPWHKLAFYGCLVLFTAFAAFDVFHNLSYGGVIYEWDEARHGVNAYEMLRSGNYMVNTYAYSPDYWNSKPPLSLWQIALAYRLFGYNTFALRFFSALYLPIIVASAMWVLNRYTGTVCAITTGFLFATTGTRFTHLFTSGDPDALFFLMCYAACLFLYIAYKEKPPFLVGAGLCTAFAFLTKGSHVVSLFVVIAVNLVMTGIKRRFSGKQLVGYLLLPMAVPVLLWVALRFSFDGLMFFEKMLVQDTLNRVGEAIEGHTGGRLFYVREMARQLGAPLFWSMVVLSLLGLIIVIFYRKGKTADGVFVSVFGTMAVTPLILFSLSATKLTWYVYPCLIGVYFVVGYAAQQAFALCRDNKNVIGLTALAVCSLVLLGGGFVKPYAQNINTVTSIMTSQGNPFSQMDITPEIKLLVVDAQGNPTALLQSWLLQAYFSGFEVILHGMDAYTSAEEMAVVLRHTDDQQLNAFKAAYPQLEQLALGTDYAGVGYAVFGGG